MWTKVDALIATKKPAAYDEAVRLLGDLKDHPIGPGHRGAEPDPAHPGGTLEKAELYRATAAGRASRPRGHADVAGTAPGLGAHPR